MKLRSTIAILFLLLSANSFSQRITVRDVYFIAPNSALNIMTPFANDSISIYQVNCAFSSSHNSSFSSSPTIAFSAIDQLQYTPNAGFVGIDTIDYFVYNPQTGKKDSSKIYAFVGVSLCGNLQQYHTNLLSYDLEGVILNITDSYSNFFGNSSKTNINYFQSNYFLYNNFIDSFGKTAYFRNYSNALPPLFSYGTVLNIGQGNYNYYNVVGITLRNYQVLNDSFTCYDTTQIQLQVILPINDCRQDFFKVDFNSTTNQLNVMANDTPHYSFAISISYTPPKHGSILSMRNGIFYYSPKTNFAGNDTFQYNTCYYMGSMQICDSAYVVVNSTCKEITSIDTTICNNNTCFFKNKFLTSSGIYWDTLINQMGCDSFIRLNLRKGVTQFSTIKANLCPNQSYNFNGKILNHAGNYIDTIPSFLGCDSIITLHVNSVQTSSSNITPAICNNDYFHIGNHHYNQAGNYIDTITNHVGCDSIVHTHLIVSPTSTHNIYNTICMGDSVPFKHKYFNTTGNYIDTISNHFGCDSFLVLHLFVASPTSSNVSGVICNGSVYNLNGKIITTPGTFNDTIQNYNGCDSVITIHLTLGYPSSLVIYDTICSNQFYILHGKYYNRTGIFHDTIINASGCDSITVLHLKVKNFSSQTIHKDACSNKPYFFRGNYLTQSGIYHDTLVNQAGCDSIVTLIYSIINLPSLTILRTICHGDSVTYFGKKYKLSGNYILDTIPSHPIACDTLLYLNLNVVAPDTIVHQRGDSLFATTNALNYQWINCATKQKIKNAAQQIFSPDSSGSYAVIVNKNGCYDTSNCYTVSIPTGIENLSINNNSVKLFPNPADEKLRIEMTNSVIEKISIIDVSGRIILERKLAETTAIIDVQQLPNGLYLVELTNQQHQKIYQKLTVLHH